MVLQGKNVVITGCLRGIGKATLELCAQNGANIWACCQFSDENFIGHVEELARKYNVWMKPVFFDLTDYNQIKEAINTIRSEKQSIDALINVAGMTEDAIFHMISIDQMKRVFEVNFFSQMLFTQYITKLMLRQKSGSVVNVSSISAIDGNPGQLSYSASKAAIIAATKTLSAELAPLGIRVNAVAPGVIETEMVEKIPKEMLAGFIKKSSLKHLGLPEEVGNAIIFLASDLSSYMTGQILRVDGGIG
ncbi:MAG: SDR family oxidoreductase [Gammaproteobacteria bacterium]